MKTVIGLFDDREEGMRAYTALHDEGFALADLDILTNDDEDDVPKLENLRRNLPASDAEVYLEGVRQGGTIITANVADSAATRAAEIMSNFNMVVIADRVAELRKVNPNLTLSDPARDENVLEVIEEDLQVGKTAVERGRMRIYSVVTEREVSQNVALRDETLRVSRRPVNRQVEIRPDLFQERSFEMVEMDEIALVGKTARVVEEIVLGKEVSEKIETIKETLRRQDVEIEEIPAARPFADYDADFRAFYNEKLSNKGVQYDELRPAFNYGYSLATREPFRSSPWSAVEQDARRIWEEKNPGTWDQNKAVIHYAWEKVRSAR
ncbi:YsnF/AvaK domain-containing protein [Thermoleptolyngbya oregonensis NK1-22]|jgi:stress response protein YsnF|uniref:YsnF/AvaK domain-containing protein n=1 Tax=Thermoleptolyngbya oregonensis NK1-22 TaxID=2547457 RepID=A0AA96YCP2_9CYAN|nr:YsnF/AvaK domain-containing protein [Thermoleptolyngbya oregonensis]WOB44375.1 YsnF/AvaK domain-containing protein [Thermoleptolyngbya oregonensis NK1-22]